MLFVRISNYPGQDQEISGDLRFKLYRDVMGTMNLII